PEERFQIPAELAAALEEILQAQETFAVSRRGHDQTMVAPPNPFVDIDLPSSVTSPVEATPRPSKAAAQRRWPLIAASAFAVLLSGTVLLALLFAGRKDTNTGAD